MNNNQREEEQQCKHEYDDRTMDVSVKQMGCNRWYRAKRFVVFCKNCGHVSYDKINDSYGRL